MATGKQGFVRVTEPQHLVQKEKQIRVQAPVPAMYLQAVSGLPSYPESQPAAVQDTAVIPLSLPMMYANQPLPLLTLHIASGAGLQQQRPEMIASATRPKSAGKHVCLHCGRDCLKPSVLEKHLRCHTGERPYPCPTCGISFKTQSNLYKHKRTQAHARLSSESGKGAFSSQESTDSSRENCSSPLPELQNEDLGDTNRNDQTDIFPAVTTSMCASKELKTSSETEWALCKAAVVGSIASPAHGQQVISHTITQKAPQLSSDAAPIKVKSTIGDGRVPLTPNRTPLQRQEALLPKSQSYDSTDSGFSESSEQQSTSSPAATVSDPSMDLEEAEQSDKLSDVGNDDAKSKVSLQEKQKLEKHISKLISENSLVMDDKHLVNVRPRKTVLSKQGSIDLPMPYTYKDSFHFEMRSSKHQVSGLHKQDRTTRAFYSSMPTQNSTSLEHAPLSRSSSLPFSMGVQKSDSKVFSYPVDVIPLSRRCSAGHINPFKSVDHNTPCHRSLVRQVAVDGLSAVEGSLMDSRIASSLSSDGDCNDTTSETAVKKCRRKKAEKFAYNKWYMYGGGTFKKLYSTDKDSASKSKKCTVSPEKTNNQVIRISQQEDSNTSASITGGYNSCPVPSFSPVFTAQTSSQVLSSHVLVPNTAMKQSTGQPQQSLSSQNVFPTTDLSTVMNARKDTEQKDKAPDTQYTTPIPSERKKQKTENRLSVFAENTEALIGMQQIASRQVNADQHQCVDVAQNSGLSSLQRDSGLHLNRQGSFTNMSLTSSQRQLLFKRHSSPLFVANMTGTSASPSVSSSASSVSEAKTSFLPKYQLKIPVLTDGMSAPCLKEGYTQNPSSPRQNVSLNQQSATTLPSSPHKKASRNVKSHEQGQGTVCTAITKAMSVTSSVYSCQNVNAYTSTFNSTMSASLAFPLACTELSVTPSTTQSPSSPVCHLSSSRKNKVHAEHVTSVQDNLVTIPTQSSGVTPTPILMCAKDGIPLEISSTEVQGSQDTFYMQTADLQIVMQLISDEQLALIEPQIETQDFKSNEGHGFLSKDPGTSGTGTVQTGVSREIHKKCSGNTGKNLEIDQRNVKLSLLSNIPDVTPMSTELTNTDHKAKSTESAQDVYLTSISSKGVIYGSPSKSKHDISALLDDRTSGHECKYLGPTTEDRMVPKDPEILDASKILSEKLVKPLADKYTAKHVTDASRTCLLNQLMGDFPTSLICNNKQSCPNVTHYSGISPANVASTSNSEASSECKLVKPEKNPKLQPFQMTVEKDKSLVVTKSTTETNTSCITGGPPTPVLVLNLYEPIQPKSCQASTTETKISSQNVQACRVCPQRPLNQTSTCSGDKQTSDGNQSSTKSGQHLTRQGGQEVKTIKPFTASLTESHGTVLKCLEENNIKSGGMLYVIQDSFKGPPVSRSLQSSKLHWEAGTTRPKWIPLEAKNKEEDGAERVGMWDVTGTRTKQEEEVKEAMENNREEVKCTEVLKVHPEPSTSQHENNVGPTSPELVSNSATAPSYKISNPSPNSGCLTNKFLKGYSLSSNVSPKHIDQRQDTKEKKYSISKCHENFSALSKRPGDVKHLLDEETKNSELTIMGVQISERETVGESSNPGMTSPCNTEHCKIKKNKPTYTHSSFPIQTTSSCIQLNPSCTSSTHSNYPELGAPHSFMVEEEQVEEEEEENEEEEEERSSSSDDEGKLVIELE